MWVYKKVLMGTLDISMKASNTASGPCYNRSPTTTVPIGPSIDCHDHPKSTMAIMDGLLGRK